MSRASCQIDTGSPISSTKISPPSPSEPGADDELHRLRDRHEVAGHPLVGDRHRAAEGDLAAEDRHDRARRAEHVAEAHDRVARLRASGLRPASTAHSASAFDAPMTVAGRDGLVGRDQDEALDARLAGDARHQPRGERVVAHRLDRVELHEPDVLVGGGVEDDGRAVLGEDLAHPLALLAVGEDRGERRGMDVAVVLELALDAEEVVLGVVEQDQPARRDARDLAAELGADRAARAGDHHDLAVEVARRRGRAPCAPARGRGRPRPGPRAPGGRRCAAGLQQLEDRRQRADRDPALAAGARRRARAACPAPTGSRS